MVPLCVSRDCICLPSFSLVITSQYCKWKTPFPFFPFLFLMTKILFSTLLSKKQVCGLSKFWHMNDWSILKQILICKKTFSNFPASKFAFVIYRPNRHHHQRHHNHNHHHHHHGKAEISGLSIQRPTAAVYLQRRRHCWDGRWGRCCSNSFRICNDI